MDISQNKSYKYICIKCNYKTDNKTDFNKHILTLKHNNTTKYNENIAKNANKFICNCGKMYPFRSSLYNHKKKCTFIEKKEEETGLIVKNDEKSENNEELKKLVCKLITENNEIRNTILKENSELRAQVSELIPKIGSNNTLNQKFNIQVFLNEKCKNAINMNDFVKSIEISSENLDFTKQKGLAEGLSNAIVENMNKLSVYQRPMHCTDTKRETLYIKDDNNWSKDGAKEKLKKAIKSASSKNYKALQKWRENNPDFMQNDDKKDYFVHVISAIGKSTDSIDDKIIKNLCKETYVKSINE